MFIRTKLKTISLLAAAIVAVFAANVTQAQSSSPTPTPSPTPKESEVKKLQTDIEDVFRIRKKGTSNTQTADFGYVGVLNIGYGYGNYSRAEGFRSSDTGTLIIDFAATDKIGFDLQIDTINGNKVAGFPRSNGFGDVRLTSQLDVLDESKDAPSFAVSYFIKFPTGSAAKGLGSGRFDQKFATLFSKTVKGTAIDFNAALLVNGEPGENGYVTGGEFSASVSRDLSKKFNLLGEVYGETKDSDQPKGWFASGVGTYQLNKKTSLNFSVIVGLTPNSPRYGGTFGITFTLGNLYKNK